MKPMRPILLTMADFYGTLAATRCLGEEGIPVTLAEWRSFVPGLYSRFVTRAVTCPPITDEPSFISWLMDFGSQNERHVLYPTSDEMAWLFAKHQTLLSRCYDLYSPHHTVLWQCLNKSKLAICAQDAGIAMPITHSPQSFEDINALLPRLQFPLLIKPQTQIYLSSHTKGYVVQNPDELLPKYKDFMDKNGYERAIIDHDPNVKWPLLQEYLPIAAENIFSISGFIDRTGTLSSFRGARKVLQRPRKLGIGLCFEGENIPPALQKDMKNLCLRLGYYGAFEAEFIAFPDGSRSPLLIDFNPRFYSQMAFDIDRKLPLPSLIHAAALGDDSRLQSLIRISEGWVGNGKEGYTNSFFLWMLLTFQGLSGKMSKQEVQRWKKWVQDRKGTLTDASWKKGDTRPRFIDNIETIWHYLRHPRYFWRSIVMDQA